MGRALGAVLLAVVLQAQVTLQMAVDMNMVPARDARGAGDWSGLRSRLTLIPPITSGCDLEVPPEFHVRYAEGSLFENDYDDAIQRVVEYVKLVGREGARYAC